MYLEIVRDLLRDWRLYERAKREVQERNRQEDALKEAWACFLGGFNWDYFFTVTFRSPRQSWHSEGTVNQLAKYLARRHVGGVFVGTELHRSRAIHAHGLINPLPVFLGGSEGLDPRWYEEELTRMFGWSRVSWVKDIGGVTGYVTKYCVKGLTAYQLLL